MIKKKILWLPALVLTITIVSVFTLFGCAPAEEPVTDEPVDVTDEPVDAPDEPDVVAQDTFTVGYVDALLGPWAELIGDAYVDYFADIPNFEARSLQVQRSGDIVEAIELTESLIAEEVDGILLLVFHSEALMESLSLARQAGIKFGTVGTKLAVDTFAPEAPDFVVGGVNYEPAYALGVQAIEELIDGEGNVVIIGGVEGSDVAEDRKAGFEDAAAEFPGVNVLFSDFVGFLDDTAYAAMSDLLVAHDQIDIVFTPTDPAAQGAFEAAVAAGRQEGMYFTGWDLYDWYAELMREHEQFYGTVAALPYFMGTLSAQLLEHAVAEPEFMRIELDCEFPVVTLDNLDDFPVIE